MSRLKLRRHNRFQELLPFLLAVCFGTTAVVGEIQEKEADSWFVQAHKNSMKTSKLVRGVRVEFNVVTNLTVFVLTPRSGTNHLWYLGSLLWYVGGIDFHYK